MTDRRFDWSARSANPYDTVLADQDRQVSGAAITTAPANADAAARANALARSNGLPAETVERNLPSYEREARNRSAVEAVRSGNPYLQQWYSNPRNAAAASDDVPTLKEISDIGQQFWNKPQKTWGQRARETAANIGGALTSGTISLARGLTDAASSYADWQESIDITAGLQRRVFGGTIYDPVQRGLEGYSGYQKRAAEARRPNYQTMGRIERGLTQGVESVPGSVAALAATIVGAPTTGLSLLGTSTYGQSYREGRDNGLNVGKSILYGAAQGAVEVGTERIPVLRYLEDMKVGSSVLKRVTGNMVAEQIGEQAATHLQDFNKWALIEANQGKSFGDYIRERPEAALDTALAVASSVGATNAIVEGGRYATESIARAVETRRNDRIMSALMDGAEASKLRARDAEAFHEFVAGQVEDTPAENIYIPAEAIRELNQDYANDELFGEFADQIDEALALDGDVVLPTAIVASRLAGTDAWNALKAEARFSPGGMSQAELASLEGAHREQLEMMAGRVAEEATRAAEAAEPAAQVYAQVRDQLANAGFSPDAADRYAQLWTASREAWAARLGTDALSYHQANPVDFRRILPEALAKAQATDGLDLVINAMRGGKEAKAARGPTLLEWISKRGGIEDRGGDIASMGGNDWHRAGGRRFAKKLIRPTDPGQASMLGDDGQQNSNSPEELVLRAWEVGFFPEFAERPDVNALLDAIGEGLRGNERYAEAAEGSATAGTRAAAEELRAMLEARGIDADTATTVDIRKALELQQSEAEANADTRGLEQGVRGRALIGDKSPGAIIDLFQASDLSTIIHESGHVWLEEFARNAKAEGAPADVVADWQAIQAWFAANGAAIGEDGYIPTEAHELWARGWERYALEGKSPSAGLRRAFDAFRGWLLQIYKHVANLRVELTPEVRDVFDRMLATQDAITEEAQRQNARALFTDAAQAGMTDAEFAAYQQATTDARSEAFDALLYRTMATIRRSRTKAWKDEERGVRDDVTTRMDAQPAFRALHLLRTGQWLGEPDREGVKVRLDRQWLVDTYGEDALALMPRGVPPIYGENGTDAETLAEMVGYRNANDMVTELMGVEREQRAMREAGDKRSVRTRMIDEETAAIMRDRHGDPLNDGSIEEEALAAINNGRQAEVIAAEARQLGRQRGLAPTPYRLAREWAQRKIAEGKVVDVASRAAIQRYARASAKAAKSAEAALVEGNVDEAFRQKQAQLLNHALLVEAKAAADEVDTIVARLGKLARRSGSKTIAPDYFQRIHQLLEDYSFRQRSQASLNEQESFEKWAEARRAQGFEVVTPDRLAEGQHYTRMSVEELRGLNDAVKSVETLGRLKQKMKDAQEEREWSEYRAELYDRADASQPDRARGVERNKPENILAELMAGGWKVETLAEVLDAGESGPWNDLLVHRATDAENNREALRERVLIPIAKLYNSLPDKVRARLNDRVTIPELVDSQTGQASNMTRLEFLAVILNAGNESNLDKMARGEKWSREGIDAAIGRLASKEDFDLAQSMWDAVDSLREDFFAVEERMTGLRPEAIKPREMVTPFGSYRGGYWPLKYDYARSVREEDREKDLTANAFMSGVSTRAGAEQARTGYAAPIRLSVEDVLFGHVEKVITRIAYGEYARDVLRVIKDQRLTDVIDRKVGPEVRRQIEPWLKRVVGTEAIDHNGLRFVERLARSARTGVSIVAMGLRFKTGLAQTAGLTSSVGVIGKEWMARGVARYAAERGDAWQFIADRSPEMVTRTESVNREIAEAFRGIRGQSGWKAKAQAMAFWHIGMADRHIVAGPTWIGAHMKGLSEGMTDEQASRYADKAVRKSQGANRAKDLSAWQAPSTETLKWLYMFSSYFAQQHQAVIEARYAARRGDYARAFHRTFWFMTMAPLAGALIAGDLPDGGDDDETGLAEWIKWVALKMGVNMFASIPVVRDVANVAEKKATGEFSQFNPGPITRIYKSSEQLGGDLWDITFGDGEASDRWVQHAIETPGYFLALPTGQPAATSQFLWEVWSGDADPETVSDWYQGLTTGRLKKDEKR